MPRRALVTLAALVAAAAVAAPGASALDGLAPGMKAPVLTLETLDGRRATVGAPPGKGAVLVVFWAGWSTRSAEVLERVERLHSTLGPRGLAVIGVNVESPTLDAQTVSAVKARVGRLGITFPILLDRGLTAYGAYGIVAVPSSVLVGADGKVLAALASYPIAGREEFFDLVEATVSGLPAPRRGEPAGPQPNPRAVRYFNLGRADMARGLAEQAAANLGRAVELDPTFAPPRVLLGRLRRERALAHEGIAVAGEKIDTVRVTAGERARLLDEAQSLLTDAVALDATDAAALTELALVHRARGDVPRTRELLTRALAARPGYPPARGHLGALLLAAGDVPRGRAELTAAIEADPLDWRLHITAAEAYEARGLVPAALDAYRRGIELLWQTRREAEASSGR